MTARDGSAGGATSPETGTNDAVSCVPDFPSVRCVATATPLYTYDHLAVDGTNIYVATIGQSAGHDQVLAIPRAGGVPLTLAESPGGPLVSDGSYLYWIEFAEPAANVGAIVRVPVTGGSVATLAQSSYPACLTVDETRVYWSDEGAGILAVPKAGGTAVTLDSTPDLGALAMDPTTLYATSSSTLVAVDKAGGSARVLSSVTSGILGVSGCRSLAVVGSTLVSNHYESVSPTHYSYEIVTVPTTGSTSPTVIVSSGEPGYVVANADGVFWAGSGPTSPEIARVSTDGGAVTTLATPETPFVEDLALSPDGTLYWATYTQVQAVDP